MAPIIGRIILVEPSVTRIRFINAPSRSETSPTESISLSRSGAQPFSASVGAVDEHTLVVDDLSDSGNTCNLLRPLFPQARFVTVYAKPAGRSAVDVYAREMPDSWLVFPWD